MGNTSFLNEEHKKQKDTQSSSANYFHFESTKL